MLKPVDTYKILRMQTVKGELLELAHLFIRRSLKTQQLGGENQAADPGRRSAHSLNEAESSIDSECLLFRSFPEKHCTSAPTSFPRAYQYSQPLGCYMSILLG